MATNLIIQVPECLKFKGRQYYAIQRRNGFSLFVFFNYQVTHAEFFLPAFKQLTVSVLPSAPDELFAGVFSGVAYRMKSVPQSSGAFIGGAAGLMPGPGGPPRPVTSFKSLASVQESASPIETVRTFFPETWIWDLVEVG